MKNIAVLITVFNRIEKTLNCLHSLFEADTKDLELTIKVFLTDDGSSDGTTEIIKKRFKDKNVLILPGTGNLFWNGGMNNSWRAALKEGSFDGFLWLNNDSVVYPNLWKEIFIAEEYSNNTFGRGGIYVGSTWDKFNKRLSYGGFLFTNKWTLNDKFLEPNGQFQVCHAAHGNITYVSKDVADSEGIFCDKYIHGGGDHDYTYLAHKHGFPLFVLRTYVGECVNDHVISEFSMENMSLRDRLIYVKSPLGYNLNNTLLFQKRCFPYRYPFVWCMIYFKLLFPKFYYKIYRFLRS